MTGFAQARRALGDGELVISLKALNHRGLDIQVHAPTAADAFENAIRALVKSRMVRGHVEVRVNLPQGTSTDSAATLNHTLLDQYLAAFQEAAIRHGIDAA